MRDRHGQLAYALVDYELLERTPEHEQAVRSANRKLYLTHMAHRFEEVAGKPMPDHLRATSLLGVDFVFGRAESTGGLLWVVGRDPDLFSYFLPERWRRTPKKKLSSRNQVFRTCTKDNINLVWRVSRMGDPVQVKNARAILEAARSHEFNSPFEEFALALHLSRHGIKTIYPRAIYMTGSTRESARAGAEARRYSALAHLLTPDGEPALRKDYDYITIWGFWNGPDALLAAHDGSFLLLPQRETRLRQGPDHAPDDGGIVEGQGRQTGRLRTGGPQSQARPSVDLLRFGGKTGAGRGREAGSAPVQLRICPPPGWVNTLPEIADDV